MWFTMFMAARNLVRNLRRTLLSMGAVIAGVAVLILGNGFIGGLDENIIRAQVDSLSGHVLVRPVDYPVSGLSHPVDHLLDVDAELAAWLDEHSTAWTERVLFTPRAVKGGDSLRVRGIGFDPVSDPLVFPRATWHVNGRIPERAEDGVLVSQGVAAILGVEPGGTLIFEARTPEGAINALELPVSGVFTAGSAIIDRVGVLFPMAPSAPEPGGRDLLDELLRNGDRVSHVAVRLGDRDAAGRVAAELRSRVGADAEVVTWIEETHDMMEMQKIRRQALNLLVFVLMGMSAAGIANTILMAAYERIREIGTLRAMGMTREGVIRMFVLEGALMGFVGGLFGVCIGGGVVAWYSANGIDLSGAFSKTVNLPIATMLYLEFSQTMILFALLFGVLVATLASVWPAVVASRMQPADAVRAD